MLKQLGILWNSFKMAVQELKGNKLRTFLSLFGITIGIFCIIGVLATVDSLEQKVQNDIKALGTNTIYVDKWSYGGGPDYPWWKFVKRPSPKFEEIKTIKEKSQLMSYAAMLVENTVNVSYKDNVLNGVNMYGVSEEFNKIQTIDIANGRYINDAEFTFGTSSVIIGTQVAEELFGKPEKH